MAIVVIVAFVGCVLLERRYEATLEVTGDAGSSGIGQRSLDVLADLGWQCDRNGLPLFDDLDPDSFEFFVCRAHPDRDEDLGTLHIATGDSLARMWLYGYHHPSDQSQFFERWDELIDTLGADFGEEAISASQLRKAN